MVPTEEAPITCQMLAPPRRSSTAPSPTVPTVVLIARAFLSNLIRVRSDEIRVEPARLTRFPQHSYSLLYLRLTRMHQAHATNASLRRSINGEQGKGCPRSGDD